MQSRVSPYISFLGKFCMTNRLILDSWKFCPPGQEKIGKQEKVEPVFSYNFKWLVLFNVRMNQTTIIQEVGPTWCFGRILTPARTVYVWRTISMNFPKISQLPLSICHDEIPTHLSLLWHCPRHSYSPPSWTLSLPLVLNPHHFSPSIFPRKVLVDAVIWRVFSI